jgi:transposase
VPFEQVYLQARDSGRVVRVTADKAYDGAPIRNRLKVDRVKAVIPSRSNQRHKRRCPKRFYRLRHKVENFFRKLFDFRRVATRYDKLASCFLSFVHLVSTVVLLRGIR